MVLLKPFKAVADGFDDVAAAQAFVSYETLRSVGQTPFASSAGMMALAFVLHLCSEADAFVAASFVQFTFASKLAFLVFGPMLDIKLVAMYLAALPRRVLPTPVIRNGLGEDADRVRGAQRLDWRVASALVALLVEVRAGLACCAAHLLALRGR